MVGFHYLSLSYLRPRCPLHHAAQFTRSDGDPSDMLAAVASSVGFAAMRGSLLIPARSSRALSGSRVCLALDGEIEKSLYALGQKIGVQLGDLKCFTPKEIDSVFAGMKDNVIGAPSQVRPGPARPAAPATELQPSCATPPS
jgi:hypothetical protein